jgi:hypothetical protein
MNQENTKIIYMVSVTFFLPSELHLTQKVQHVLCRLQHIGQLLIISSETNMRQTHSGDEEIQNVKNTKYEN